MPLSTMTNMLFTKQEHNRPFILIEKILVFLLFFLFPIMFIPIFPDSFGTAKLYFLAVMGGAIIVLQLFNVVATRKVVFHSSPFRTLLYVLGLSYILSVIVSAPNRAEALLDPNRGALMVILFIIAVLLLPKEKLSALYGSMGALFVLLVMSVISYFQLFAFLPSFFNFVNQKTFTLTGNMLTTVLYSAFFLGVALDGFKKKLSKKSAVAHSTQEDTVLYALFTVALAVFLVSIWLLVKEVKPSFMPYRVAWEVSVEGLKNIKTAVFGVGPGNYLNLYTQGKPFSVNALNDWWQVNVEYGQSSLLHIFSEIGLVGLAAYVLILFQLVRRARHFNMMLALGVLGAWFLFFPLTHGLYLLFFLTIFLFWEEKKQHELSLADLPTIVYSMAVVVLLLLGGASYLLYRAFMSEYYLMRSYVKARENKAQETYDLQRKAVAYNPYSETARLNFAQTNMLLAGSIAQKKDLKDADKQTVATLIQQGIEEAKALVSLNQGRAVYWANLAHVYSRVVGIAQGADAWTITSYQRAISLDRNNPMYFYQLGSLYYALGNFEEAAKFFTQAVSLRPIVANFHYNLAWTHAQRKNYTQAVSALNAVLQLIDPKSEDYKKAKKELDEFKKLLPPEAQQAEAEKEPKPETLQQPVAIPTSLTPTITLPENSAPPTE